MYRGQPVLDVHGHMSTPPHFRAYAMNLIALRTAEGALEMSDELMRPALARHLRVMDERKIDVTLAVTRCATRRLGERHLVDIGPGQSAGRRRIAHRRLDPLEKRVEVIPRRWQRQAGNGRR